LNTIFFPVNRHVNASLYSSSHAGNYTFPHPYQHAPTAIVSVPGGGSYHSTASYDGELETSNLVKQASNLL